MSSELEKRLREVETKLATIQVSLNHLTRRLSTYDKILWGMAFFAASVLGNQVMSLVGGS